MNKIILVLSAFGTLIISQMGGWSIPVQVFLWFMCIDYVTGLIVAFVFKNSPKTKHGKGSSGALFKGLLKKFVYVGIVILSRQMQLLLGVDYILNGTIIAFIMTDGVSILENVGLMGINLPKVISDSLELLSTKERTKY